MNVKVIISFVLCLSLFGLFVYVLPHEQDNKSDFNNEFLRVHIRANSNDTIDQEVKYKVKDAIVQFLTPLLCNVTDKQSAMQIVANNLSNIESVANTVLRTEGFCYTSNASLKTEEFPTRTYQDLTLPSGVYDSLIVNLGTGTGNNWWCVVYPPLCFVNTDNSSNVTYKSKLVEIINSFWRKYDAK